MRLAECIRRNQNKFSWEPKHSSRQCLLAELNIRQSQHFKVCCWAEVYHSRHFKMLCWAEISAVSAFYSISALINPYRNPSPLQSLQPWLTGGWGSIKPPTPVLCFLIPGERSASQTCQTNKTQKTTTENDHYPHWWSGANREQKLEQTKNVMTKREIMIKISNFFLFFFLFFFSLNKLYFPLFFTACLLRYCSKIALQFVFLDSHE